MDEAHRSLFNTFKEIIDYFDAFKVGLTATPKDKVHASSMRYSTVPQKNQPTNIHMQKELKMAISMTMKL